MPVDRLIILAGGFGTRLSTLVSDVPKPLAPICEKPFLFYILRKWVENGIKEIIFLLHHRASQIEDFIIKEKEFGILSECKVIFLIEDVPLGTGGAVANAVKVLGLSGSYIITNSDTWLSSGYKDMINSSINSISVVQISDPSRFGGVKISGERIASFQEKSEKEKSGWINAGVYHLDLDVFLHRELNFSVEKDIFPEMAKSGGLKAIQIETDFIDIGIPQDYIKFCSWIKSGKSDNL